MKNILVIGAAGQIGSELVPDWHVEYLEDNPWIHQPFECYDALGPAKLIELVEAKEAVKKA